jgi:hypothetical protein
MYCELIEKADLIAGKVERPGLAEDGSHPDPATFKRSL